MQVNGEVHVASAAASRDRTDRLQALARGVGRIHAAEPAAAITDRDAAGYAESPRKPAFTS